MKDIKAVKGRAHILDLIAQGEHEQQDFKYAISDARKIARSISAFANRSGGRLLVGVKDNGHIAGVRNEEDIYVIEQAAEMYCRPPQRVEFTAYSTGETGVVIVASVAPAAERPVCAQEPDKKWNAYYRVDDENIHAHPLMVRSWRRRADMEPMAYAAGGADQRIVEAIDRQGWLSVADAIKAATVSRRTAEMSIVRLAAMGIVDFEYREGGFVLIRPDEP